MQASPELPRAAPSAGWRAALALLLLAAALWAWQAVAPPLPALAALPPAGIAGVTAALATAQLLRALRLRLDWRAQAGLGTARCLRMSLGHGVGTALLPMRLGEFVLPWLLRRHGGLPVADAAATLLWMRLQDALVLLWLGALTAAAVAVRAGLWPATAAGLAAVLATLAFVATVRGLARLAPRGPAAADDGRRGWRAQSRRLLQAARAGAGRTGAAAWACCIGAWCLKFLASAACLVMLAGIDALPAWAGALGGDLASALPVQPPAGFGFFEAGVAATAAGVAGVPAAPLLGAALVLHGWLLAVVLVGAALAWAPVLLQRRTRR